MYCRSCLYFCKNVLKLFPMQTQINCPKCGTNIDVNNLLKQQIEHQIKKELSAENEHFLEQQKNREAALIEQKKALEAQKRDEENRFEERLLKEKNVLEKALSLKVKNRLEEENTVRLGAMEKELNEKTQQLKSLNEKEAEILRLQRAQKELEGKISLETEKKVSLALDQQAERLKKQANEQNELAIRTLQKQLDDQKKLTAEMKRKQEQGSMQLQGEVMELAMEEWLEKSFPLDTIDEIKKGALGADCLQTVNTRSIQNCGTIYYESKRTKSFSAGWIEKFKNDIRERNADIGVLVTEIMPADLPRMGLKEGVWICTYEEFKGLSAVLRETIIQLKNVAVSQENKGDKMTLLYDFLISNEFKLQVEGIVEGFTQMQSDLNKEKNAMSRIWKQREKQIVKVVQNTLNMYGAIKGIAGNAVKTIPALELGDDLSFDL